MAGLAAASGAPGRAAGDAAVPGHRLTDAQVAGKYPCSADDPFTHGSRLAIMWLVRTNETGAAAAARIGAGLADRKRAELLSALRSCFVRTQTWQHAGRVRVGAGQRAAEAERVDDRRACGGPYAGPDPAAAQPGGVGHVRRDEPGAPVRGGGSGRGRAARRAAGRPGDRRDRRDGAGEAGPDRGCLSSLQRPAPGLPMADNFSLEQANTDARAGAGANVRVLRRGAAA